MSAGMVSQSEISSDQTAILKEKSKAGKTLLLHDESEFVKEDMDETVFMFALFKCRKFDKRRN